MPLPKELELLDFKSRHDNLRLKGIFIRHPENQGTIFLAHPRHGDKAGFTRRMFFLYTSGYNIFSLDFRGHGESQRFEPFSYGHFEQNDILGTLDYLKSRKDIDQKKVGGCGLSLGAAALILAAAREKFFKALVLESGYSSLKNTGIVYDWGPENLTIGPGHPDHARAVAASLKFLGLPDIAPAGVIEKIAPAPVFIIGGEQEAADTRRLFSKAAAPKEFWIVPGAGHGECYLVDGPEFEKRVLDFFSRTF